jgi:hypothetical protein
MDSQCVDSSSSARVDSSSVSVDMSSSARVEVQQQLGVAVRSVRVIHCPDAFAFVLQSKHWKLVYACHLSIITKCVIGTLETHAHVKR